MPATHDNISALLGVYRRLPVENPWHVGTISYKEGSEEEVLQWENEAGVSWCLVPDLQKGVLMTNTANPYYESGAREFKLEIRDGKVVGFWFNNELFARDGFRVMPQLTGGLKGYISMHVPGVPDEYGYGVSFYSSIWPLLDSPLSTFQIGLPSTWIIPLMWPVPACGVCVGSPGPVVAVAVGVAVGAPGSVVLVGVLVGV